MVSRYLGSRLVRRWLDRRQVPVFCPVKAMVVGISMRGGVSIASHRCTDHQRRIFRSSSANGEWGTSKIFWAGRQPSARTSDLPSTLYVSLPQHSLTVPTDRTHKSRPLLVLRP